MVAPRAEWRDAEKYFKYLRALRKTRPPVCDLSHVHAKYRSHLEITPTHLRGQMRRSSRGASSAAVNATAPCSSFAGDATKAPTKLVLFAARRTGSSWLADILRKHPQVLMHGEIFHIQLERADDPEDGFQGGVIPRDDVLLGRRRKPLDLLRFVECHRVGRRFVGFKFFRDHLRPTSWHHVMDWCDICVILRREDVRAQYASLLRARATGEWKGRSASRTTAAVANVSTQDCGGTDCFHAWQQNQAGWYKALDSHLDRAARLSPSKKVVRITYEHHLANRARRPELAHLWHALGVDEPAASNHAGRRGRARATGRLSLAAGSEVVVS